MLSSKKIAVLMGGPGSEREVSLASGKAVLKALLGLGLDATAVDVTSTTIELPPGVDLAFNLIHGTFGEDGQLQAAMEKLGVPYTGAGVESSRKAFDKNLAKAAFVAAGVPTPKSEIIDVSNGVSLPSFSVPFVVKAPCQGSSVGVHIVKDAAKAMAAMEDAAKYGNEILVEEFVSGYELTVPVIDDQAYPVVHIIPPDGEYDFSSKYPWLSGGIEVYSRVDVLLDDQGRPFVLEANTIPGMTETSLLPKSAAAAGISFPELCQRIGELSLKARSC
jgi:D-alanine-D-alanine ligase